MLIASFNETFRQSLDPVYVHTPIRNVRELRIFNPKLRTSPEAKSIKNKWNLKSSTSHVAVLEECGQLPPSIQCKFNVLCCYNRLQNIKSKCIVKDVFDELKRLHGLGFGNWVTKVNDLAHQFNIQLNAMDINDFNITCKIIVQNDFIGSGPPIFATLR